MSNARFRAGMVGAGTTCELHVAAVKKLAGADVELVGIADDDREHAKVNAERWGTTAYADVDALVKAGANVIHVLTQPSVQIASAALEKGCHVLLDTPLTDDVDGLVALAKQKGRIVSVHHALLDEPQVARALDAAKSGALGRIETVDIVCGSEYPLYEGGPLPPWYRDAGYAFADLGVHCMSLIQELLGPIEDVDAGWRSVGGEPNLPFDDWRATVRCKDGVGQLQLTWSSTPPPSTMEIRGAKGVLRVDLPGKRTSPLPKRLIKALTDGVAKLVTKGAQADQGDFVADFYRRLSTGEPPLVTLDDVAPIVAFGQRIARKATEEHEGRLAKFELSDNVPFLVTGASGSLGRATVKRLLAQGHRVRVLVRRIPETPEDNVEYCFGNLGDPVAVDRAVKGAQTVIHAGAAMKGGWPEHKLGTVVGTQNVVDACRKHRVKQLVYISSMSVVDWAGSADRGPVSEGSNLEPRPEERGAYTRAKLEAERLVTAAAKQGMPCVILRPGQIFGGGIPLINGAVARGAAGRWLVLGDGKLELPLVYIDDVVDAILQSIEKQLTQGEVIQIIDPDHLTQKDVLELAGGKRPVIAVPRPIVFALGKLSELPLGAIGKQSPIAVYRLKSALARLHYESDRAANLLGWQPRIGVREGIRRVSQIP